MKVTYLGGPYDGQQVEVNPRLDGSHEVVVPIIAAPKEGETQLPYDPNRIIALPKYKLNIVKAQYIWEGLKWPLT